MLFQSSVPYEHARIHAAAIYCSDGRVGEQFDDFCQNGLALPRYDRVALPGGPACLAGHEQAHLERDGVVSELKFLVDAHELNRVVLIAHEGCAYYGLHLGLSPEQTLEQQRKDLAKATTFIREVTGVDRVESYLARLSVGRIQFEDVRM